MPTTLDFDITKKAVEEKLPGYQNAASPTAGFGKLLGGLMSMVMVVGAILVFFYLIWGAIDWITSGGDKGKIESARHKITQAVIGLIVLASTTAIFIIVQSFLDICVLSFGGKC